ncbi:uncharacterized protein WM277_027776 [Molossus nigricans]
MSKFNSSAFRNQDNESAEVTFILLGFSEYPELQVPLFLLFLSIYTVTVLGNLGMIMVIKINPKLHTPMYYFLSHLSFVDFCYSTVVTPKLLENLVMEDRTISFTGCIMQFFFACIFVVTETFMLAVMAYDRFVAVCNPLLYTVVMSQKRCSLLVGASYSWGIACSLTLTYFLLELSFRGNNIINNFVCEHAAIVSVSCSDPYLSQEIILVSATFNEISSLTIILTSYGFIFITIMKMPSPGGRHKAFSTCASHMTAITIFHGTILFLYCVPNSKNSWLMVKVASVFYTVVIPMLNPLIYSLRNNDVKETVRKLDQLSSFVHKNKENQSDEAISIFLGFSEYPELQVPLSLLFLTISKVTVLGNLGMLMTIKINSKLHTPIFPPTTTMLLTKGNQSAGATFTLLGFSEFPDLQVPLFLVFLTIYTVTVLGNLGMIMIIKLSPQLHTPMYFFLSHLSFVDFCYSTTVTPKLLENLVVEDRTISFAGCIMQFFSACLFAEAETFMLAVMAYDRFVAICNPLLYTVAMSPRLCALLVAGSYLWGMFGPLVLLCYALQLNFFGYNVINHFFCEYTALIAVSSSDTHIPHLLLFGFATFNEVSTLLIILASYVFIFATVLNIRSASGRRKAFSTCASHLMAITIFHGTILSLYCVPNSKNSQQTVKVASVFYTVVNPMLNPLIYSLRNKDVKDAFWKFIDTKVPSH